MNSDKKNQHYLPKFYLRNFSYSGNNKQIGLFNLKGNFYFDKAKLKTQGSKNFFYGYDGVIEDKLSEIEGILAKIIKNIIETESLPSKESPDHIVLLSFVALTHLRNPAAIKEMKDSQDSIKKRILELDPLTDTKFIPEFDHNEAIKISLSTVPHVVKIMSDLSYKLLLNETSNPFISSDFPIIKYNQFLEEKKWKHGKTGYGNTGLQIFIPINSRMMLVFYDSMIYKVGFKKRKSHQIKNSVDVDNLNILQFVNCFETIFFDEKATEHYIRKLFEISRKYKKANQAKSELSYIMMEGEDSEKIVNSGKKNLLITGSTDCEINLDINGIKMHSGSKGKKLHPSMAQLRPWPSRVLENKNSR